MKLYTHEVARLLGRSPRQVTHLAQLGRIPGAALENAPRGAVWVFRIKPRVLPSARPPGRPRREINDEP